MATRITTHILKNSDIVNRPLPSTLLKGEAIVNTADGIMFFSGSTTSTSGWTQSGPTTPTFFEVGSNLYDLKIRNKIASYSGLTNLSGKFLSGTTSGFVLADISSIVGVDTYTTAFTYSNNVATIKQNQGQPDLSIVINTMTGLTVNGTLSSTTINGGTANLSTINATAGTITTLASTTINANQVNATAGTVTTLGTTTANIGTANIATLNATAGTVTTLGSTTINANQVNATAGTVTTLASTTINANQINATAGTITTLGSTTINGGNLYLSGGIQSYSGQTNLAGQFLSGTTNGFVLGAMSAITGIDTFTTGFTYTPASNTLTIKRNLGQPDLTAQINTVSGLTISNLTANRFVYTTTAGLLTTGTATFDGTNAALPTNGSLSVGTGGLIVGSGGSPSVAGTGDLIVNGNLTVFGNSVSAFTSNLFVEDNNIGLNYNPTGSTIATSIGAGWTIQDGNGIVAGDVNLNLNRLDTLTGLTVGNTPSVTEYTGSTGYANRGWITQLNDIVIRSTNVSTPNGVRVLTEFDILDGGIY